MPSEPDTPRALIRYALVGLALTGAIVWTLYLVRGGTLLGVVGAILAVPTVAIST